MEKVTNMYEVKNASKLLFECVKCDFDSFIVHHPYTNSPVGPITDENGNLKLVSLDDPENYNMWRDQIFSVIDSAETPTQLVLLINKPWLLTWFKFVREYLDEKDYGELLRHCWITEEFPNSDRNVSLSEIVKWFKEANPIYLMEYNDFIQYKRLKGKFSSVYRGINNKTKPKGLSWTLDREKAKWFSKRFNREGDANLLVSEVKGPQILAYFSDRNESEVIVNTLTRNFNYIKL